MTEQQTMLADMVGQLFAELGPTAEFERDWARILEVELPGLLIPEAQGGFGGNWEDAGLVFRLAGRSALNLPVTEAIITAHLAVSAGWTPPSGMGSLAGSADGVLSDGLYSGTAACVPWGRFAAYIVLPAPDGEGALLLETASASIDPALNPAGEPRDSLHFSDAPVTRIDVDLVGLGAFARSAQIAGALDAALAMSIEYVNERQQFGRPIAKFQAVQQALASFACEAVAANTAAVGAAQALRRGDAGFEIAAAKLRANMAVGEGTATAHQVHGAIGFTEEYALHRITRRLWSWRSEFGGDALWSSRLGGWVAAAGADQFWPSIADRTDPMEVN